MNHCRATPKTPAPFFAAVLTTFTLLLTGCGDEEQSRDYTIPRTLCGTTVDSEALAPFLPAGQKLTVKDRSYPGTKGCQVIVDGTLIVTTAQMWIEEGKTTTFVATRQSFDTPDRSADSGRFRYSGYEAFGKTRGCLDPKYKQELYAVIQASGSKHRDPEAMRRLIVSFTEEVEESDECRTGATR